MEAKFRYVDFEASNQLKGKDQLSHPDIVEGVGGISWVVYEAVPSIVTLWEGDPELGVNVFHELSSIVHRLDWIRVYNTCLLLHTYWDFDKTETMSLWIEGVFQAIEGLYQHTNLEQDKDEEQLVHDADTKPKPPVSYRERKVSISDTVKIKCLKINTLKTTFISTISKENERFLVPQWRLCWCSEQSVTSVTCIYLAQWLTTIFTSC